MRVAGLEELNAKFQKELRPWGASLEITRRCNLRCIHCLRGLAFQDDGLPFAAVCTVLDQLAELGCMRVLFTGGEPLARPDLVQILEETWRRRMASVLLTNGTLITAELADRLSSLCVHEIRVSLYGASALVHEAVTRTRGSFSAALDGIRLLVVRGLRVSVVMPVLALNVKEVAGVRQLCAQLGTEFQYSGLLFPQDNGSHAPLGLLASEEQLRLLAEQERRSGGSAVSSYGVTRSEDRLLCTAGAQQLGIGPDGSVYPCGALRLAAGNVHRQDLRTIWYTSPLLQALRHARPSFPAGCGDCRVRSSCLWCPGLSLRLEGDMAVPNRQDCRRTRLFHGGADCGNI